MVTLPAAPPPEPHQHRTIAESFGVDAERYDRARLGYPDALISRILNGSPTRDARDGSPRRDVLDSSPGRDARDSSPGRDMPDSSPGRDVLDGSWGRDVPHGSWSRDVPDSSPGRDVPDSSPGRDVLDVGCGTGIAARQFRDAGCRVLGVEPDQRMAEFARHTGIDVETAKIEDWDPAGRVFDVLVSGTAWHWVDPTLGAAKAASVLRPGGRIALFWHTFEMPAAIAEALADVYRRVVPDSPISFNPSLQGVKLYQPGFTSAAESLRATSAFTPAEQWQFDWQHTYTRDAWLDQLPTTGGLTRLSPEQQAEILRETGKAIDAMGGTFHMPYATVAVTATKIAP